MRDVEQAEHLDRVSGRIGAAILAFYQKRQEPFHMDDLRRFVAAVVGPVAPASADRILRQLRLQKRLNYRVVSRRQSLYVMTEVAE